MQFIQLTVATLELAFLVSALERVLVPRKILVAVLIILACIWEPIA